MVAAIVLGVSEAGWGMVGAVSGVIALLLSVAQAARRRPHLDVEFGTYVDEGWEGDERVVTQMTVANIGQLTAFISKVETAASLPPLWRWPVFRSMSFRLQRNRLIRWIGANQEFMFTSRLSELIPVRLEPGESIAWDVDRTFPGGYQMVARREWLVLTTARRRYVARLEVHPTTLSDVRTKLSQLGLTDEQLADKFPILRLARR